MGLSGQLVLLIFCFELTVRIMYQGARFVHGSSKWWHLLDITVVGLGLWDVMLTVMPSEMSGADHRHRHSIVKSLRLVRLVRLIRLAHLFPSLMTFIKALWDMLHKFVWIFFILFLFMFCSSIILTMLLGQNEFSGVQGMEEDIEQIRTMFRTVPESLFSLFQVTTCDNWMLIAAPAIRVNPYFRIFFIVYVVFASWILISILTAVASDAMISSSAEKHEAALLEKDRLHQQFIRFLEESFVTADTNSNGILERQEFCDWIDTDTVGEDMATFGMKLTREEYLKAWDMLDIGGEDELCSEEFVSGFSYLHEALCTTHVVNIDYSLKRISLSMQNRIDRLSDELNDLTEQGDVMLKSLELQESMQKAQTASLWLWKEWVRQKDPDCLTPDMAEIHRTSMTTAMTGAMSSVTSSASGFAK